MFKKSYCKCMPKIILALRTEVPVQSALSALGDSSLCTRHLCTVIKWG